MILKFKRFWSCLLLVACTLGLITPTPSRANGNGNVELQVLGIVGACAAVGGAIGFVAGSGWLRSCRTAATIPENSHKISIDAWCTQLTDSRPAVIIENTPAFEARVKGVLGADEITTIFKKSYQKEKNRYSAFLADIDSEMNAFHNIMERAKNLSFVSGLTETLRYAFTLFPELDWKHEKFKAMCKAHNLITRRGNIYPIEEWTDNDIQNVENDIYEYIEQVIPKHNSITKLAVEVWWLYLKKYYQLKKLRTIIAIYSTAEDEKNEAERDRLKKAKAQAEATGSHAHQYWHAGSNNRAPIIQPQQQQVQPLQVDQQKPNYLKRAAYIMGGLLMGVGLYSSCKMISQALNINTRF